ncbi:T9SS type A sorting domain-containing protein [Meridianimaribacter flavus]
MKNIYFLLCSLFIGNLTFGQTTINFDNTANWTYSSGYSTQSYSEGEFSFSSNEALRETTGTQDGFPKAFGTYALRLRNNSSSEFTANIATGGVDNFSVKIRRWDGSPSPDFTLEYSINGGTDWTDVATINNTTLNDSSDWVTFGTSIQSANSNILIRIKSNGSTERIMIDDFTWTGFSSSCGITIDSVDIVCNSLTLGDNNDSVTINVNYNGVDASITEVATTSLGVISGDDPATTENGTITITGLSEGDNWDLKFTGSDCVASSGTIPSDHCEPAITSCFDISNGAEKFEMFTVATNSDSDVWTESSGTYNMNGYCGGGCEEVVNTWLLFGPLDLTSVSDLALKFNAQENFGDTPLAINYTAAYSGCPDTTSWSLLQTITESDAGDVEIDLSALTGTAVFIGIQYYDDGVDGYSNWDLSNVELTTYNNCPVLGARPTSDCPTLSIVDSEQREFSIFPNPTSTGFVNIVSAHSETISVNVYDMLGKQVINETIANNRLNVSTLNAGVYIMKISQGNTATTQKIVIK